MRNDDVPTKSNRTETILSIVRSMVMTWPPLWTISQKLALIKSLMAHQEAPNLRDPATPSSLRITRFISRSRTTIRPKWMTKLTRMMQKKMIFNLRTILMNLRHLFAWKMTRKTVKGSSLESSGPKGEWVKILMLNMESTKRSTTFHLHLRMPRVP